MMHIYQVGFSRASKPYVAGLSRRSARGATSGTDATGDRYHGCLNGNT